MDRQSQYDALGAGRGGEGGTAHVCHIHLICENLILLGEGEHLHREAFDVGWDSHPGVGPDGMEDGDVAVVMVLTAGE